MSLAPGQRFADRSDSGNARQGAFWWLLLAIVAVSCLLRLFFLWGPAGTDDNVYLTRALEISQGQWPSSDYIGALRYGFNIPAGFLLWIFGPSFFVANLYPFILSLAEIVVVAGLARRPLGDRTALLAGLILAVLPLHIARATSLHADAVLTFYLTASFALFWVAGRRDRWPWWVATGLCVGMVYWVKEVAIVFALVFGAYALLQNRWTWGYLSAAAAALLMFVLSCALMWAVSGDPLHILAVTGSHVGSHFIGSGNEQSPTYYIGYLFLRLYHSWILGYLALGGLGLFLVRRAGLPAEQRRFLTYGAYWLVGLLLVFSCLPISFSPFSLISKQSNYLSIFFAPLALFAAFLLAGLPAAARLATLAVFVAGAVLFTGLTQQDLRAFVANGKSLHAYAQQAGAPRLYGSQHNHGLSITLARSTGGLAAPVPVLPVAELLQGDGGGAGGGGSGLADGGPFVLVGHDPVTHRETIDPYDPRRLPACWERVADLPPSDLGPGRLFAAAALWVAVRLPEPLHGPLVRRFKFLAEPPGATVYRVPAADPGCIGPRPAE